MTQRTPPPDDFYVGYLPMPWSHSRVLRFAVPITLWLLFFCTLAVAWSQRYPGEALWDLGTERTWEGTLLTTPYPMLVTNEEGIPSIALIVQQGKIGAQAIVAPFADQSVTVHGWLLERDGRRIIELAPGSDAIRTRNAPSAPLMRSTPAGQATIRGEIMDAKCFLGAMKPGEGKAHQACAQLCIRGGIPPMLVSRNEAGIASYYLLTDPDGRPMSPALYHLIGEPVTITGTLSQIGDLSVLAAAPSDVSRR